MTKQKEIWRDIEGYEGKYQVSNLGRVRGLKNRRGNLRATPLVMKPSLDRYGYFKMCLRFNGENKCVTVHRLVAQTFIPNPDNKPCVNHINGIKTDCCVRNLEWVTHSENTQHAYDTNLCSNNAQRKLTNEQAHKIREEYIKGDKTYGVEPLARKYGVYPQTIRKIVQNKTYKYI